MTDKFVPTEPGLYWVQNYWAKNAMHHRYMVIVEVKDMPGLGLRINVIDDYPGMPLSEADFVAPVTPPDAVAEMHVEIQRCIVNLELAHALLAKEYPNIAGIFSACASRAKKTLNGEAS